jgi:signal transduction histidine kinase
MELEHRVQALESEIRMLKHEIRATLEEIQASLPEKPVPPTRWQKKAWVLALLNLLVAITLFTNIYLYIPGSGLVADSPMLNAWLRAFWVAIAFMWLLLQMYPLALLLEQEDREWNRVAWRNATTFFSAHPGVTLGLTTLVVVVAVVNAVFPLMWFVIAIVLLIVVAVTAAQRLLERLREQAQNGKGS